MMRKFRMTGLLLVAFMIINIAAPLMISAHMPPPPPPPPPSTGGEVGDKNPPAPPSFPNPSPNPNPPSNPGTGDPGRKPKPNPNPPGPPTPPAPEPQKNTRGTEPNPEQKLKDIWEGLNLVNSNKAERYIVPEITRETQKTKPRKFEDPDELMSRSDFLMAMIQSKNIIEGRKLLNYTKYVRYNGLLNTYQIISHQPVEDSGFLEYLGKFNVDPGTTDVVLSHEAFGRNMIISNPNVIELYLAEAYQKGLITLDELDTRDGGDAQSLKTYLENTYDKHTGSKSETKAKIATRWDPVFGPIVFGQPLGNGNLVGKLFEHDNAAMGQYPSAYANKDPDAEHNKKQMDQYAKDYEHYQNKWSIIKTEDFQRPDRENWNDKSAFWGSSYKYITNKKPLTTKTGFDDLIKFDEYPTYVVKVADRSVVRNTQRKEDEELTLVRRLPRILNPNGYAFFLNENITLLEAYVYTYKYLKALDNEVDMSEEMVNTINSSYGVNTSSMTADEAKAVNFLIAMGVVDGEDTSLYNSFQLPLTNRRAVDLIYKIKFPDARKKTMPTLSDVDKAMLEKGYGKVSISVDKEVKEFPTTYISKPIAVDEPQTAEDIIRETMSTKDGRGEYELLAIRYPANSWWKKVNTFKLMVNDQYRTEIPYQPITTNQFNGLEDGSEQYWRIYTVHKDTVSDLKLLVEVEDQEIKSYNFTGISGAGLYWIDEDNSKFSIRKWGFDEISQSEDPNDTKSDTPVATYLKQKDKKKGHEFIKKLKDIRTRLSMYHEDNSTFQISLRDGLRRLSSFAPNKIEDNEEKYTQLVQSGMFSPDQVARLARIHAGYTNNEIIWTRPHYAAQTEKRAIIRGPMSESQLQNLKFGGESMITMNNGKPEINVNNNVIKTMGLKDRVTLVETEMKDANGNPVPAYNIQYLPKSNDLTTESAKFFQHFSEDASPNSKKFGGYAKLQGENGESLILVSKEELPELGITALSDKVLWNEKTGQRAFINTDDNVTLIGNNITHYGDGKMMVNAFGAIARDEAGNATGGRDESKIFYNLDIVMELINDTDVVQHRAGKDIYIGIDGEAFDLVQIRNTEDGGPGMHPVIDLTYKYKNKISDNTFVNLSGMAGITSNFIFYKNRVNGKTDNEALIVYKPFEDYMPFAGKTDNTLKKQMLAGSPSENQMYDILSTAWNKEVVREVAENCLSGGSGSNCNGIGSSMAKKMIDQTNATNNDYESHYKAFTEDMYTRNSLIKHLFIGSNGYEDLFPKGYGFKLFILNRTPDKSSRELSFTNFYTSMALNLSDQQFQRYFRDVSNVVNFDVGYISTTDIKNMMDNEEEYYKYVTEHSVGGLMAGVLDVATSPAQAEPTQWSNNVNEFDLMIHEPTGNLYMNLGTLGSSRADQLFRYQYMFGNNIFLQEDVDIRNPKTGKIENISQIYFKPRHIYENSPRNTIPLEVYANNDGYYGGMFLDGGRSMKNFELRDGNGKSLMEKPFKLYTNYSSNTAINKYDSNGTPVTNPGMFTRISANPIVLDFKWTETLGKDGYARTTKKVPKPSTAPEHKTMEVEEVDSGFEVDKKGEDKSVESVMLKYLLSKSMEEFDRIFKQNPDPGISNLNVYNAVYGAEVAPDEMDMRFLSEFMVHSWGYSQVSDRRGTTYDLTRDWSDRNNVNLSGLGLKEGDEVVFLNAGLPKEFVQQANKLTSPVLKDLGAQNKYQVYMVKDKVVKIGNKLGLTNNAWKTFHDMGKCREAKAGEDCKEEWVKPLIDMSDLKDFTNNYNIKVLHLPSIGIPYGTALVNRHGYPTFLPNAHYREEVQYATNMINSLIFRMRMNEDNLEGRKFLWQIPKGSVVKFGDSTFLLKASPQQSDNNRLKWVEVITSPKNVKSRLTWAEVSDYANLDWFLRGFANKVMIPYDTSNSAVSLKSIVGKGIYNVPAADLVTEVINTLDKTNSDLDHSKAAKHINSKIWVNDVKPGTSQKFIIDPVIGKKHKSSRTDYPQGKIIMEPNASRNGEEAKTILLIYLPPTIEVVPVKEGVEEAHYTALMYHDIRGFVVDPDDSYVQYLRERDTDAEEILKDFEQIQAEELDGRKYTSSTENKLSSKRVNKWITAIEKVVPIILMTLVFLIWVIYLGLFIPLSRRVFVKLGALLGMQLGEEDSYGNIDLSTIPSFITVFWVTVALTTVAVLIDQGLIVSLIVKLFDFFKHTVNKLIR